MSESDLDEKSISLTEPISTPNEVKDDNLSV